MSTRRILIVEDEAIVALDLKMQLEAMGYQVPATASSAQQARELVRTEVPDLILMDVRLQGDTDGIQAAEAIRREAHVPVIFLTSHSDDDTVQRAARVAPYGYLTKPYQIRELRAGIEVALTKFRMERQLREADRWFAHTLQCVVDGVVVTDRDAKVRFLNPAAESLTGWGSVDAAGRDVGEVVRWHRLDAGSPAHDAVVASADDTVRSVLAHGRPVRTQHSLGLMTRDGSTCLIDRAAGPIDDEHGQRLGAVLILRDATERIRHEKLLRSSESRFRGAFDHAPLGMALVSFDGSLLQVNEALCRLLGATPAMLKACGHNALTMPGERDREQERLDELRSANTGVIQFERHYLRMDGREPVWTLVSVSLMHEDDVPTCYLYQVHDLTEHREAATRLAELAEERLRREASELASTAKSEFLSRASHELRTPLNAVIGFAQLLEMQSQPDLVMVGKYATHIRAAGEHMLVLVNDLLDLNRVAEGRLQVQPRRIGLEAAVAEAARMLQSLVEAHDVTLTTSVSAELHVLADPVRLRQVLLNLGSNAIKYNRQGGAVRISAEQIGTDIVQLCVEDTGIGMTPRQLERLFQPFDRLGQEQTRIEGVGLGLVIARSLMLAMEGTLDVKSQARVGTQVVMTLRGA